MGEGWVLEKERNCYENQGREELKKMLQRSLNTGETRKVIDNQTGTSI